MKKFLFFLFASTVYCLGSTQEGPDDSWYMYLIEQGKKWVNEKVIVNHGDTTFYYYTYEIQGKQQIFPFPDDPDYYLFDVCYYYIGPQIDLENDSIVSLFHEYFGLWTKCYNNRPYQKIIDENRNMIKRISFEYDYSNDCYIEMLYYFSSLSPKDRILHYLHYQTEPKLLTEDNLIIAEPILIGGKNCQRMAYINEQGDTLAYVVEGIGFDSYDLGDLLTPFTRKPDPDADYQEWCGLSHVVKDGKIIYKGMRYRHGAFDGIDEVVADKSLRRPQDDNYYNLMGQPVGKDVPTAPGIYIHNDQKIIVNH